MWRPSFLCACSPGTAGGVRPASSWGKRSGRRGPRPGGKGPFSRKKAAKPGKQPALFHRLWKIPSPPMECETSGAKKPSLPPPVRNPPLALIQTEKRRRGPDSLPPTPQRAFGPLQGPRTTSDWKTRSARFRWRQRVRGKTASSPGAGGTQKRRRGPNSLPPTPQRRCGPLQGPRATSDWKKRASRVLGGGSEFGERRRPPPLLAGHRNGDEA